MKDFYNDAELDDIDREIEEQMNRPTLLKKVKERRSQDPSKKTSWTSELEKHWYIYAPLAVSAVFTTMLGIYMGLTPHLIADPNNPGQQIISFNTDWGHSITAVIYVIAFLFVTEIAFAIAHDRFHKREEDNGTQSGTMIVAMVLAGISIIGTGVSGGIVVASTLGFLTEFREIPASAQKWVVVVIPILLGVYTFLYAAYKLSSRQAQAERIARESEEEMTLDNQMRMRQIELLGKRKIQTAAIRFYERMVMEGLMSPEEAEWAKSSGKSLADIERELGRDLTGEGKVGDTSGLNRPALKSPPKVPQAAPRRYTADDLCGLWGKTRAEVGEIFATYNNANHFYSYATTRQDWLPKDMTFENFADIWDEILSEQQSSRVRVPSPVERSNGKIKDQPNF